MNNLDKAKELLVTNNIRVMYEKKVPYIINRTGDGQCPIETCVYGICDLKKAFEQIKKTLLNLSQK